MENSLQGHLSQTSFVGGPTFFGLVKGGGTRFFQSAKEGGTRIFCGTERGDKNFSQLAKGGPESLLRLQREGEPEKKLTTGHHKQTAPSPLKNDSSL